MVLLPCPDALLDSTLASTLEHRSLALLWVQLKAKAQAKARSPACREGGSVTGASLKGLLGPSPCLSLVFFSTVMGPAAFLRHQMPCAALPQAQSHSAK